MAKALHNGEQNQRKNKFDRITCKRVIASVVDTLRLWYGVSPVMVVSQIVQAVWEALSPYFAIYMSALIINELAGSKDKNTLARLVLITLIGSAVISLISALLTRTVNVHKDGPYQGFFTTWKPFVVKNLNMDYAVADDQDTKQTYSNITQYSNIGYGQEWTLERVAPLIKGAFTALGGIALSVSLFTKAVPNGSSLAFLNNPLFIIALLAVMILITVLAPAVSTKARLIMARHIEDNTFGNRMFTFIGMMAMDPEYALDQRMYKQYLMGERINSDKQGMFGSKGPIAKNLKTVVAPMLGLSGMITVSFTGIAYMFVCLKAIGGAFGIGSVTQYVSAITNLSLGISQMLSMLGLLKTNTPYAEACRDYLNIPQRMYKGSLTVEKRLDRDYEVEFRNVSFKYPGSENYALKNVNIKFKIGERLAVVGENGSGKTTFINLLCRLYDPVEGEILLNGINIQKYNYQEYLGIFSVVFQDFQLPAFKLGEVVASSISYDKEKAVECLEKVGFGDRLKELQNGLDTYLYKEIDPNGVTVSGGEGQKIALARALYKDSPFIVLDEPTAALDSIAEAEIYSKFNDIAGDKTAIYISHRLSSCRFCDDIAVFDHGSIVQKGTHDDLVETQGKYSELWDAQAQYYNEEQGEQQEL